MNIILTQDEILEILIKHLEKQGYNINGYTTTRCRNNILEFIKFELKDKK